MSKIISFQLYKSPLGEMILGDFENKLCLCDWYYRNKRNQIDNRMKHCLKATFEEKSTPLLNKTIQQLELYFSSELKQFDLPLMLVGTDFQKSVWEELQLLEYGKTMSYLELSRHFKQPKAIRAVASANGANALAIIIPCHRIIGNNNDLVGYAGGIAVKKKLLAMEQKSQLSLFE